MNKYEKFIKRLGNMGDIHYIPPSEARELFPELFETKLEVGKWCKRKFSSGNSIICFTGIKNDVVRGFGFFSTGEWKDVAGWGTNLSEWQPATDKEVEEMLIKEAKKRFDDNVLQCLCHNQNGTITNKLLKYYPINNGLWADNVVDSLEYGLKVFSKGKWATIIERPLELTMEQVSEKYGREVKIVKK